VLAGCAGDPLSPRDAGSTEAGAGSAAAIDAGSGGGGDAHSGAGGDAGTPTGRDYDVPFTAGTSTVAGGPDPGWVDGGRKHAQFANPVNVAYRDGLLYVADFDNDRIRVIDLASYETTTLIAQIGFQRPFGLALATDGTLYVSTDNDEHGGHSLMSGALWRISPGAHSATLIASGIGRPRGIAVLPDRRLAVTDYLHHVVELVDPMSGLVSPLAGMWDSPGMSDATGSSARFANPYGLVVRSDGALVVADYGNDRLRVVTLDGSATTLAGGGTQGYADGEPATAQFFHPQAVAIAANGDIYVADSDNFRIRRVTAAAVETIAGDGTAGYADNDDPRASRLYGLEGLAVAADGSMVYVADGSRGEDRPFHRVRQIAKHW
jgi:DNA-binding beta-propeller fold protein YncE